METIDTIIFDFGDTLVVDTVRVLEERYGYKKLKPAARQYYWRALLRSETGKAPVGIFLRAVQKTMMPTHTLKAIEDFIVHTSVLPTWKLAKKLAKRYDVIILSNNQKSWPRKVSDYLGIDFLKYPFVNSAREGLHKPNPMLFKRVLRRYKLVPAHTLFIDDKKHNVAAAKKLGFTVFQYQNNPKDLVIFLKKCGIAGL